MITKNTALRRWTGGVGALAIAAAGFVAFGAAAATAAVGPDQPGAPGEGTLTILKYKGAHTEDPSGDDLLDGVTFRVTQVGIRTGDVCDPINLTEAEQWDGLEGLFDSAPAAPTGNFCFTDSIQTGVTEDGEIVFELPVGVYFVQETDSGPHPIVSPVPNFYVSIPTSNEAGGDGWNYNVVAHPKNQLVEGPTKTIETQQDLVIGGNVTWTLTVPIPTFNNDEDFETASVTDVLDDRLSYESSVVSIGGTTLVEDTHYEVDEDGVTWTFLPAGLALLDANQGGNISISLVTTVDSVGDGSIPNDDYSSEFNGVTVPGNPVPYTYWGQLKIMKTDDSRPARALAGAEFQVFDPAGGACPASVPASGSIATGTSGSDGVVRWDDVTPNTVLGLWVANSTDGPLSGPSKVYCVYETVAPAGHTGSTAPVAVTITPGAPVQGVSDITVVNPKRDGPDLPLTGAEGTLVMLIIGVVIVVAGAVVLYVARRRISASSIQ